jgi:hypothetical protein
MSIHIKVPATGHSEIFTTSGNMSLAQYATYSLGSVANTASLVLVLSQKDHNGSLNYPSALYYCSYGREPHVIHNHGASWDNEDGGSDFVLYESSGNVTFKNRCSTTTLFCFHVWNLGGV